MVDDAVKKLVDTLNCEMFLIEGMSCGDIMYESRYDILFMKLAEDCFISFVETQFKTKSMTMDELLEYLYYDDDEVDLTVKIVSDHKDDERESVLKHMYTAFVYYEEYTWPRASCHRGACADNTIRYSKADNCIEVSCGTGQNDIYYMK